MPAHGLVWQAQRGSQNYIVLLQLEPVRNSKKARIKIEWARNFLNFGKGLRVGEDQICQTSPMRRHYFFTIHKETNLVPYIKLFQVDYRIIMSFNNLFNLRFIHHPAPASMHPRNIYFFRGA